MTMLSKHEPHAAHEAAKLLLLPLPPQHNDNNNNNDNAEPQHISSRLPPAALFLQRITEGMFCAVVCVALAWVAAFGCLCALLARANTPDVHASCSGFWDFMLASLFAPVVIPCLYCAVACCLWIAWTPFYGACSLVMAVACLHMSLTAGENGHCVEALRRTSEPLPWLLYAGYIKGALFTAAAVSSFWSGNNTNSHNNNSAAAAQ